MSLEGFPQSGPIEQEPSPEVVENAIDRARMLIEAQKVWKSLEQGAYPMIAKDPTVREGIIESLEFLKEKHNIQYTPEEQEVQYAKVDAFIEKLKGISDDEEMKIAA